MVIDAESAPRLLAQCDGPRVRADEEALPFRDQSLDLVVSGLALQLVNDLPGALVQIRRALKPDGLLLAALLGGNTLVELRNAFLAAEEEMEGGASPRVAPFADVQDLGALLQRARFALPVVDADTVTATYADALALMREVAPWAPPTPCAPAAGRRCAAPRLLRALEVYRQRFGLPDGRVPATFEIVTLDRLGAAREPAAAAAARHGKMRLADAGTWSSRRRHGAPVLAAADPRRRSAWRR